MNKAEKEWENIYGGLDDWVEKWSAVLGVPRSDENAEIDQDIAPTESPLKTAEKWKLEGRCPKCGELGDFVNLAMTCSNHGVY